MTSDKSSQFSRNNEMPELPEGVIKYKQVPDKGHFTKDTVPDGILRQHSTKKGVWGIIKVFYGTLNYIHDEEQNVCYTLDENTKGVIEPCVPPHVANLSDDLEFIVELYKLPEANYTPQLPEGVIKYTQVPEKGCYTKDTIPYAVLKPHSTKAGTWGLITVFSGTLDYIHDDEQHGSVHHTLDVNTKGLIEPCVLHHVADLSDDVEFSVSVYKQQELMAGSE